jgi:hypothetical protein
MIYDDKTQPPKVSSIGVVSHTDEHSQLDWLNRDWHQPVKQQVVELLTHNIKHNQAVHTF